MTAAVTRIFFSYARSDATDFVLRVARALRAGGHNVWVDQIDIPKGARWDDEVEKALKACTCQLVVLSPASVISSNVMDEVSYALGEKKTVIPILYKPSDVPFRLKRLQYVDFSGDFDEAYRQLLAALPGAAEPAPPAPSLASPIPAAAPIADRSAEAAPPTPVRPAPSPPDAVMPAPPRSKRVVPLAIGAGVAAMALAVYLALPDRPPGTVGVAQLPASAPGDSVSSTAVASPPPTAASRPAPQPVPATFEVKPVPAPSPEKSPQATAMRPDQQLRDFVDRYLAAQGRANAADLLAFYADKVDFYDQRAANHDFILKDKSTYYKRWPDVQKSLAGPVQIERSANTSTYALSYPVQYQVKSAARGDSKSGTVREELVLRETDGRLLIISQREQTLSAGSK